jgi:hypothetical protein
MPEDARERPQSTHEEAFSDLTDPDASAAKAFSREVQTQYMEVVQKFRLGKLTKFEAAVAIDSAIPRVSSDDPKFKNAFASYCNMFENFESLKMAPRSQTLESEGRAQIVGRTSNERNDGQDCEPTADKLDRRGPSKRGRSPGSDVAEEPSAKKAIDSSLFPWQDHESGVSSLPFTLQQTLTLLENYARDPKAAKTSIVNSPKCPQFPDSEWNNLVTGRAVNLDHVLSGLFTIADTPKRTEQVGDIEISFASPSAAKAVKTHGEWLTAWTPMVTATVFAFPHRETELNKYGQHISQLFAALPVDQHDRVIAYDKAARIRIAQRRDLMLTDYHEFGDIYTHWVHVGGTRSGQGISRKRADTTSSGKKKKEPCRRWNE